MDLRLPIAGLQAALSTLSDHVDEIETAGSLIVSTLRRGNKLLVCGNGGSAAEAQHLVTELVGRYRSNRQALPALFLGGDATQMSCIANDFSWNDVFSRSLRAFYQEGDLLVCFSTSGRSANLIAALEVARDLGVPSLALLGGTGGPAAELAQHRIVVGSGETARVQEIHLFLLHCFCDRIEMEFGPEAETVGRHRATEPIRTA